MASNRSNESRGNSSQCARRSTELRGRFRRLRSRAGTFAAAVAMEVGNVTTWMGDWSFWRITRKEPPSPAPRPKVRRHCRAVFELSPACNHSCQSPPTASICLDSRAPHGFRVLESDVIFDSKRSHLKKACSPGRLIAASQFQYRLRIRSPTTRIHPSWLLSIRLSFPELLPLRRYRNSLLDVTNNLKSR